MILTGYDWLIRRLFAVAVAIVITGSVTASPQTSKSKKIFMMTDMEGVDGIFDENLQCSPWKSPRWDESHKLQTGEINAAVDGLLDGGATEVIVVDGHTGGSGLSIMDIHPKAKLVTGLHATPSTWGLDSSFSAIVFIGQHAMAGAEKGILAHGGGRHTLVNNIPVGEFGLTALLGASFGVPTIMLSGDTAACKEFHVLVPQGECAEVKSGFNAASGTMLSHPAACALIREKARRAMERLSEFKAYKLNAPFEAKVQPEYTLGRNRDLLLLSRGAEALDDGWFVFRGNTYLEVYTKVVGP